MSAIASISKSEKAYIQSSLQSQPPFRGDGRSLYDYRTIFTETGVAPLANGSARINIGKAPQEGGGGTEVIAAVKLEVEDVMTGDGVDGGRMVSTVSCSPAAYPQLSSNTLDELQYDYTAILQQTLSHPTLRPRNLGILPKRKSWLLNLDVTVLSDAGNVYDALFMASRAALWDTKVPKTKRVQYAALKTSRAPEESMEVETSSGFDIRSMQTASDFELSDYWDEGEPLDGKDRWPVCVSLNIDPPIYYLDATYAEEAATPLRLLLLFSFTSSSIVSLQGMKLLGPGEVTPSQIQKLISEGETHARKIYNALEARLREEDVRRNQKARDKFSIR